MFKRVELRDREGSIYFEDEATKEQYRWIAAGLSWPIGGKGYLVVAGIDFEEEPSIYVLKAVEARGINEMLQLLSDYQAVYDYEDVYGDNRDRAIMNLVYDYSRGKNKEEKGSFTLGISKAPYLDDPKCLAYYIEKIKERTGERKTLFIGEENSFLSDAISSLKPEELKDVSIEDQPALFALGAVVCVLDSHRSVLEIVREAEEALMDQMEEKRLRNMGR